VRLLAAVIGRFLGDHRKGPSLDTTSAQRQNSALLLRNTLAVLSRWSILLWGVPRARRPSRATTLARQGGVSKEMIPTVIALGLVLERWWRSTLVATALVWPPQLDGS
jgi:hypothetical protein